MEKDHVDHVQQHPEPHDDDPATDPLRDEAQTPRRSRREVPEGGGETAPGVAPEPPAVVD